MHTKICTIVYVMLETDASFSLLDLPSCICASPFLLLCISLPALLLPALNPATRSLALTCPPLNTPHSYRFECAAIVKCAHRSSKDAPRHPQHDFIVSPPHLAIAGGTGDALALRVKTTARRVTFRVKNDGTQLGDSFLIMGSNELGGWLPGSGLKLTTTGSTFPFWTGVVDIPTRGSLEFK